MPRNRPLPCLFAVLLSLSLAACNLPGLGAPPTPFPSTEGEAPNAAYTAAAETIIAQLTQVSAPPGTTPAAAVSGASSTPAGQSPAGTATGLLSTQESTLTSDFALTETAVLEAPTAAVTDTPSPEPSPTQPLPPTPTLPAGDPRAGLGEPTFRDVFDSGDQWYLGSDEFAGFEVIDGDLVMTAFTTGSRSSWMLAQSQPVNFYLEITAEPQECVGLDRYGVIVRSDATVGYLYGFSCDGRYMFRRWNGTRAIRLVEWTESDSISKGPNQTNRMGIRVEGSQFSLYANGTLLTQVTDSGYATGGFGVFIGADTTQDFTVYVNEAVYWELP